MQSSSEGQKLNSETGLNSLVYISFAQSNTQDELRNDTYIKNCICNESF